MLYVAVHRIQACHKKGGERVRVMKWDNFKPETTEKEWSVLRKPIIKYKVDIAEHLL